MKIKLLTSILILVFISSCAILDSESNNQSQNLELIAEFQMQIAEPSGLCFGKDNLSLWTVSDQSNKIYQIDLEGKIIKELQFVGNDLEGIAFDSSSNSIYVVEEQLREVINLDLDGNVLSRNFIQSEGSGNSGLEGITCADSGKFILINEKEPTKLIVTNSIFQTISQTEIKNVLDLSGLEYDKSTNTIWLVSDQSKSIFNLNSSSQMTSGFPLEFEKFEGLAINFSDSTFYIVNDQTNKLYIYKPKNIRK